VNKLPDEFEESALEKKVLARSKEECELCWKSYDEDIQIFRILENKPDLPENLIALCSKHTKMAKQKALSRNLVKGLVRHYKWKGVGDQEIEKKVGRSSHKEIDSPSLTISSTVLLHFVQLYRLWQEETGKVTKRFALGDFS